MELVQLSFNKIMQTRSYTTIVFKGKEKKFAIYTDPSVGKILQIYLTEIEKPRPLTHDFITSLFRGFEITVKQVVISDLHDTTYLARIYLEQSRGDLRHIVEIDTRPTDAIILALMNNAPIYIKGDVLEKTIPFVE
jgi:uncharacterized protein